MKSLFKNKKMLICIFSLILLILTLMIYVGMNAHIKYLHNNWESMIKIGMDKNSLEAILPIKRHEEGVSTSSSLFYNYYLKDGTVVYCMFKNPGSYSDFIQNIRLKYRIIDWKLRIYEIKKTGSNKKSSSTRALAK
jgi:hypothetical protein